MVISQRQHLEQCIQTICSLLSSCGLFKKRQQHKKKKNKKNQKKTALRNPYSYPLIISIANIYGTHYSTLIKNSLF